MCISTLYILTFLHAQPIHMPVTAGYTRLTTYSVIQNDVFSFTANQAQLANVKKFTGGIYSERRFMLQELSLYQLAFALPTSSGNFGIKTNYFGYAAYNESNIGLAYGRKLSDKIDIGAQFNYYTLKIAGYGSASAVNIEAAALFSITDQFHAGIHIYNPSRSKIGKLESERLPFIYSAGMGYDVSDNFFIGAAIDKTENNPVNVNAGLQYNINNLVTTRGGIETATSTAYFGLGFTIQHLRLDALASVHPQLGVTPGLMLIYSEPKNKQ